MTPPACPACGAPLGPGEDPQGCLACRQLPVRTIGDRAVTVLETACDPLAKHDVKRIMDRASTVPVHPGSLQVILSADYRVCWAGPGTYGLYRHGLAPGVRTLGDLADVHLHLSSQTLNYDELHWVLKLMGYRFQATSLYQAVLRRTGLRLAPSYVGDDADPANGTRTRRVLDALGLSRDPLAATYLNDIAGRVAAALAEHARRLRDGRSR